MDRLPRSASLADAQQRLHEPGADPAADDGLPALLLHGVRGRPVAGRASAGLRLPAGYTAFQFVFVLLQSAAFSGVFTGFGVARDFECGFAQAADAGGAAARRDRRSATRSPRSSAGRSSRCGAHGGRAAVGMNVGGGAVDLFGLYGLAALVNFCGFFWAGGLAMRFRTIQAAPLMQMPVFLALFFAPVYVPLDLLQGWIHGVATVNPLTYLLETGRDSSPGTRLTCSARSGSRSASASSSGSGRFAACAAPRRRGA